MASRSRVIGWKAHLARSLKRLNQAKDAGLSTKRQIAEAEKQIETLLGQV